MKYIATIVRKNQLKIKFWVVMKPNFKDAKFNENNQRR